ncbi:hypothetical protein FO440_23940 [Mucilaginibacter corticis]|uniref:Glycosyl transferase n=1 Tax=Mucilaginibacter corticis TaxID=2597670 RepID=A0A556M7T2_9SPHI|nr:hypothetical protein [Mucilaginibacter corticis]TSJ35971.1 hypothetical protein FO440_23940 [Mucilaginibacter corticis]
MSLAGKLLYKFYYQPKTQKEVVRKFGGKQRYQEMLAAEKEMERYALDILTIKSDFNPEGRFKINFLTGDRFIHQSLFCVYSFFKFLTPGESGQFSVNFYSDGTLSDQVSAILRQRFPQIRLISSAETKQALKECLPVATFPKLNEKTAVMPLFKKLIYPHLKQTGGAAFFDSDMLFLKKPVAFLNWVGQYEENQNAAFGISDVQRSYGYQEQEIRKIWSSGVSHNINSGMYGIDSSKIDLHFIENLVSDFEKNFGSQYYLEQLITAIILERTGNLVVADPQEYIVLPGAAQVRSQTGTLHHYVNESKALYFIESWKKQIV